MDFETRRRLKDAIDVASRKRLRHKTREEDLSRLNEERQANNRRAIATYHRRKLREWQSQGLVLRGDHLWCDACGKRTHRFNGRGRRHERGCKYWDTPPPNGNTDRVPGDQGSRGPDSPGDGQADDLPADRNGQAGVCSGSGQLSASSQSGGNHLCSGSDPEEHGHV